MADQGMKFTIDGEEYAIDDFEGRELVEVERALGISLMADLQRGTVTSIYGMMYLIKRRQNPRITIDEVLKLSLGDVSRMMGDDDEPEADPTPAAKPRARAKPAA